MQNNKTQESPEQYQSRWEFLYEMASVKKKEREKLFEQKQKEEEMIDPECTFEPQLISNSINSENQLSFFERQQQWLDQKQQKMEQLKFANQGKDLDGCTFQPQISEPSKEDVQIDHETQKAKGYDAYVKRQAKARQLKQEKEYMLNNPYSHLSGEKRGSNQKKKHPITSQYETIKKNERVQFSEQSEDKMQLGLAMKMLHNQLYNINFNNEFNN